jgi:uncharacterized repeat protein (TIGR03837 family)
LCVASAGLLLGFFSGVASEEVLDMSVLWTICNVNFSPSALTPVTPALITPALSWDVFCRVIDNHGDLGVCWRLCADLAQRGHTVRLWVDDASALAWMVPQGCAGVSVHVWPNEKDLQALAQDIEFKVGDVVVEAFGCELPEAFQALMVQGAPPVWINLEYLSAEGYVARSHGLTSPVMSGPARGATKWFFFPGFTPNTGGLLREPDLPARQAAFQRQAWLSVLPIDKPIEANERLISLFCYEPTALPDLLKQLSQAGEPTRLLVTQGRPSAAVAAATQALNMPSSGTGQLHISQLPYLSQNDFDHLLWTCDFNFVRGEDSLVRALWAGQPFAWHIYPQDDLAHHDKLQAFEAALEMPADLRKFHAVWNGLETGTLPALSRAAIDNWRQWSHQAQRRLQAQTDLTTQLLSFVAQKR